MIAEKRRIVSSQEGIRLEVAKGEILWQISWSNVLEIAAWKDDVFAYDIICFGFRTSDDPRYHWCDEACEGWDDLMATLKQRFGIGLEHWFNKVAFPAFAKNFTSVWQSTRACHETEKTKEI